MVVVVDDQRLAVDEELEDADMKERRKRFLETPQDESRKVRKQDAEDESSH